MQPTLFQYVMERKYKYITHWKKFPVKNRQNILFAYFQSKFQLTQPDSVSSDCTNKKYK